MNSNKISVIIILYFSKHLISSIILNVKLIIKDLGEIILINNSGEDLNEFQSENITVIYPQKNLGYGAGINLGVKNSKYEFLLVLNPDLCIMKFDINLENYKSEIILSGYNPKIPGYSLKFPSLFTSLITNAILNIIYIRAIDKFIHFKRIKKFSEEILVDYISGALIFTNKKTFNKIGGFDSSFFLYYEETDFCKRASFLKIPVICTSKILFKPTSEKASSKNVDNIKIKSGISSCKRYHYKYNGAFATQCIFILLKLFYCMLILFMIPFSFISLNMKNKMNNCAYRMKFF